MTEIIRRLSERLHDGRRIVFLGVGSPLRADDSVGLYIVSELEQRLKSVPKTAYSFFLGESAPENFSGAIRNLTPSHVVIFDAAEMGEKPGTFSLIETEQIGGTGFSTHMLPLKVLTDYLQKTTGCQIIVVGIQPKLLEFAYPMTSEIQIAADRFIDEFYDLCSRNS